MIQSVFDVRRVVSSDAFLLSAPVADQTFGEFFVHLGNHLVTDGIDQGIRRLATVSTEEIDPHFSTAAERQDVAEGLIGVRAAPNEPDDSGNQRNGDQQQIAQAIPSSCIRLSDTGVASPEDTGWGGCSLFSPSVMVPTKLPSRRKLLRHLVSLPRSRDHTALRAGGSKRAFANQNHFDCLQHDDQIEKKTLVLQVVQIVLQFFFGIFDRCAVWITELRPTGTSRFDPVALTIVGDLCFETANVHGLFRSWPHKAYITAQDVKELQQFIDPGFVNKSANAGYPRIVLDGKFAVIVGNV